MYEPCPIDSNGFCPRHAQWHNAYMTKLCLDTTERGEKVRVALDKKFEKEIAAFKADPTIIPIQKKKSGCGSCQHQNQPPLRGTLPHMNLPRPNKCKKCGGQAKPTN